jgi:peptide/nickel transport system substrate-binding protein
VIRTGRATAAMTVLLMMAVACTGSSSPTKTTAPSTSAGGTTTGTTSGATSGATSGPKGGSVVLGMEQWPQCLSPITCGAPSSVWWSVLENVLPMAMVPDTKGNYVASPLLTEAPSLDNGDIIADPFTVTYHINPDANWSDGTPITSKDFDFTWRAILNTTGAYTTDGFSAIESIDTSDPKTAVIQFKDPYVRWPELFGGTQQALIEAHAFPQFENDPKPNLKDEMQTSISFSGGPWILKDWSDQQAVLVRNPDYYGKVPLLDQMTMVPFDDTNTEIQSVVSGQVDAIQPQVGNASVIDQIGGAPGITVAGADSLLYEAVVFNHQKAPLDDPKVREALMYAVDRQSIVEALVKINNPDATVLNCGFVAFPNTGPWCQDVQPFSQFTYDPAKSVSILQSDGWDCSNAANGPCTKNGKPLVLDFSTTVEDTRRTSGQELIKQKMIGTGFDVNIHNYKTATLFTDIVPKGNFQLTEYARGSVDPSVTGFLGCDGIPTKANGFSGGNWNFWCDQQASALMAQSDQQLDESARVKLMDQIYQIEAKDFLSLPLYVLPVVGAWNSGRIGGPIGTYNGSLLGLYANANEWFIKS